MNITPKRTARKGRGRRGRLLCWALPLALLVLCVYPAAVLKWYYFPEKPEFSQHERGEKEFKLDEAAALRIHGQKPEKLGVTAIATFDSPSPACLGVQADVNPRAHGPGTVWQMRDQPLNPFFHLPMGYLSMAYEAPSGEGEYELIVPWHVTHAQCEWELNALTIGATDDSSPPASPPLNLLPPDESIIFEWRFFDEQKLASAPALQDALQDAPPDAVEAYYYPPTELLAEARMHCVAKDAPRNMFFSQKLTRGGRVMVLNIIPAPE